MAGHEEILTMLEGITTLMELRYSQIPQEVESKIRQVILRFFKETGLLRPLPLPKATNADTLTRRNSSSNIAGSFQSWFNEGLQDTMPRASSEPIYETPHSKTADSDELGLSPEDKMVHSKERKRKLSKTALDRPEMYIAPR